MKGDLAAVAVANGFVVAAGLGVLRTMGLRPSLADLPWTLGLGFLVGAGAFGVIGSALLVVGLSLSWWQILLICAGLFAAGFLRQDGVRPPVRTGVSGWALLLPAAALLVGALLAVDFAVQPLWSEDAWSIWAAKANSIAVLNGLNASFLSSNSVLSPDYPLLVPVLELLPLRFGGLHNELTSFQLGLVFLAFPAALVALLRDRAHTIVLWLVALAILLAPTLQIQTASAVADVTLACFFALAGVTGWRWVESGDRAMLWLCGVFAASAVSSKLEGRVFVAILFLALGVAGARRVRPLGNLMAVAFAVGASAAPWEIWSRAHDLGDPYSDAGGARLVDVLVLAHRIPHAVFSTVREVINPSSWVALVFISAVAIFVAFADRNARDAVFFTVFVTLASLGFLVAVYWLTPLDYDYHVATSVRRVVTAPILFAASMAPLLLSPRDTQTLR